MHAVLLSSYIESYYTVWDQFDCKYMQTGISISYVFSRLYRWWLLWNDLHCILINLRSCYILLFSQFKFNRLILVKTCKNCCHISEWNVHNHTSWIFPSFFLLFHSSFLFCLWLTQRVHLAAGFHSNLKISFLMASISKVKPAWPDIIHITLKMLFVYLWEPMKML